MERIGFGDDSAVVVVDDAGGHLATMMNAHFCAVVPNLRIMEIDPDVVTGSLPLQEAPQ